MTHEEALQALTAWLDATQDVPLETMAGFFDARIDSYEAHMSPWEKHYPWMASLLPSSVQTLLDLGCGSGLELDAIFARFPDLQVTGIDLSAPMLARLEQKHPDKRLALVQGDYFALDLGEALYDAVVSFETLHHFSASKKAGLFRQIHRCLKPGGIYLECDYIAVSQAIEDLAFAECARKRRRDGIPDGVFVHFDTPLTLEHELQALRDGGFSRVEVVGFLPEDDHTPMLRAEKQP